MKMEWRGDEGKRERGCRGLNGNFIVRFKGSRSEES